MEESLKCNIQILKIQSYKVKGVLISEKFEPSNSLYNLRFLNFLDIGYK